MDKPTVLAILNAAEKIYLPILKNKFGEKEGKALNDNSLARLLCDLEPVIKANQACVDGWKIDREVVIATLQDAMDCFLASWLLQYEAKACVDRFWAKLKPITDKKNW